MKKDRLVIFDMDNTILQSNIDFVQMQDFLAARLHERGLQRYIAPTPAATLQRFAESAEYDAELDRLLWAEVARLEDVGMQNAVLEPGAAAMLAELSGYAELAVLTNNTDFQLADNLSRLGILHHFSCVVGRDTVGKLKPNPAGMQWILRQYPAIAPQCVVTVGDSQIDAQAASAAGLSFVAYNRSRTEDWLQAGIAPLLCLQRWDAAAICALRELLLHGSQAQPHV